MNQHENDDEPHLYAEEATLFHWMDHICSAFVHEIKATSCSDLCYEAPPTYSPDESHKSRLAPPAWVKENTEDLVAGTSGAPTKTKRRFHFRRRVHATARKSQNDGSPTSVKWSNSWDKEHRKKKLDDIDATELNYDSDPEFTLLSPSSDDDDDSIPSDNSGCCAYDASEKYLRNGALCELRFKAKERILCEDMIQDPSKGDKVLTELFASKKQMIWHPGINEDKTLLSTPISVEAWVKIGGILKKTVIQPKIQWREIGAVGDSRMNFFCHHIDLLDIYRVIIPAKIHSGKYPFANEEKSFIIITTDDREYLFETDDRDLVALSIKVAVARLTSQLLVDDEKAYKDFFSTGSKYYNGA